MKYTAKVLFNGNHYYAGDEVSGSKVKFNPDGSAWLYDDEDNYVYGLGDFTRYEWVKIDKETLKVQKEW